MPTIDSDRYGFVLIAPIVLLLGALASRARAAVGVVLAMFALGSVTMAAKLTVGGGRDQGLFTARGGGRYRGWMVPRERRALPEMVREAVVREGGGVVAYDDYAFHVMRFVNAVAGDGRVTHALGRRDFPAGERVFVLAWSPGVFAEGYAPEGVARWQLGWHDRYALDGLRKLRSWVQPDGAPLCELWVGSRGSQGLIPGEHPRGAQE